VDHFLDDCCVKFFNNTKKVAIIMKLKLVAIAVFALLFVSVTMADDAFAQKTKQSKNELKSIMETYRKAVQKAQSDFQAAVKKANADAKDAVTKGLPMNKINADSKAAIQKARLDLNAAMEKAKADAANTLKQLKAAIDTRTSK
jgi:hypothetical protein